MSTKPSLKLTTSKRLQSVLENPGRTEATGEKKKTLTKAEERAARALAEARGYASTRNRREKDARFGVVENPLRKLEREERERHGKNKTVRGTSIARVKRHGNIEELEEENEDDIELREQHAIDRSAAQARLGIAPPLPRSILRPEKRVGESDSR
ncbi:MAG: hypothetical protein WC477_03905 [Patescibacteria group bacterium]